ncbi:TetR/AcrR family transcriptional regulator [Leptospira andrefontaineae]|uniref:TetR/AcrR family transcriptional regulator n=1 Tax=Leptospira andrefontaineae TaxID=2484976 RepID=A0A4R9HAL4_9LEPT|nr:TetR/AcrR family transcriptional regulator [Leptospira andrefontaineae]TGK43583.1 TetR/AcrR family transcriptional regulator [Leptospira andrefontaineae]
MRISAESVKEKRNTLILKGIDHFRKFGYSATGIQEIADEAEIPKASFYNYFPTKQDFASETLEYYSENAILWNKRILEKTKEDPISSLLNLYKERIKLEKKLLKEGVSCLINVFGQELGNSETSLQKPLKNYFDSAIDQLIAIVQKARSFKKLNIPGSDKEFALFLESSWRGALLVGRAIGSLEPVENFYKILIQILDTKE